MSYADDLELRTALRMPFLPKQIGKLPRTERRPALDFVSHAVVTDRLNFVDPGWTYSVDETFMWEQAYWIRGTITIGGVSRPEFGDGDNPKDAIANFICRGAMRFGVALDLWQKQDGEASSSPARRQVPTGAHSGRDGEEHEGVGAVASGEDAAAPAPSTPSAQADGHHDHHWQQSPTMPGWQWCDVKGCGKARKKPVVVREVVEVPGP